MIKRNQLIYALKDGIAMSVENVESGLKCGCICPSCGEPLVAKKGTKRMHHFSHYSGHNCEYGYETSLHLAAKDILSKANRIVLPAVYIHFPNSPKASELYCEAKEIQIERVELEQRFQDVIPDVVIYAGGKQLFLEVYVTHAIDDIKLAKLKKSNISTIEIDLSRKDHSISPKELQSILLNNSEEKKAVVNCLFIWLQINEILYRVDLHFILIIAQLKHELGVENHMQILLTIATVASIVFHINFRVVCSALGEDI